MVIEKTQKQNSAPTSAAEDPLAEALDWFLPALRHEIRGSFNSALLNLEVAHRALGRTDVGESEINKSRAAVERARGESMRLSKEIPRLLSWFSEPDEADSRACEEWCREIERMVSPALRRSGVQSKGFEIADLDGRSGLSARQGRLLLSVVSALGSSLATVESSSRELSIEVESVAQKVCFVFTTTPALEGPPFESLLERMGRSPYCVRSDGQKLRLELDEIRSGCSS